jgi:DnaJ-class molecular chaperone
MTTAAEKRKRGARKTSSVSLATIECPFCGGTGRDPYKILSTLADCPVCKGHKTVQLETPTVSCAYCRGTGRQRHTRLTCSACEGKGAITLAGPTRPCPQCGGTGREPQADLACALCRGAGRIAKNSATAEELHQTKGPCSEHGLQGVEV